MKYMGFQIVFNILKTFEKLANWLAKYIFAYNLRKRCWRNVFGKITKALTAHHLTPKKAHIHGSIFFQNPYCRFVLEHFWASLTKPIFYFRALWVCQECLPTPKKTSWSNCSFHGYLIPWISYCYYADFPTQIVFEILKLKELCNLIGLEYFQLQLKN